MQAYRDLEAIFLEVAEVANFKSRDYGVYQTAKFQENIRQYISKLKHQGATAEQVRDLEAAFANILEQYQNNPGKYFGLIKSFVESQLGVAQSP